MQRNLSLHTLDLSLTSDIEAIAGVVDRCYTSSVGPGQRSAMRIDILPADETMPQVRGVFAETTLCGTRCHYHDGRLSGAAEDGSIAVDYDLADDHLRVRVSDRHRDDPHHVAIDVLRPVLQSFLLPLHGLKSLHGAVVARDGKGIFLAGAGGAGKSTTALAAARAGWDVLSDDGPLFALVDGRALAFSSLDFMHVSDATLRLFPEFAAHRISGRDSRGKFAIDGASVASRRARATGVAIQHYVELHRSPVAAPRFEPLDRSAMLRALIAEQMFVVRNPRIRSADPRFAEMSAFILQLLSSFAAQAAFHRLDYADEHLARLPEMFASL